MSDENNGFAILSDAAKDYEILEDCDDLTFAMGLVRSTKVKIACDNRLWMDYPGDDSGQSLREFTYRYAFMPHTNNWEKAGVYNEALAFAAPLKVCEFGKQDGMFGTDKSFIEIEGENLVLSSVTKSENDTLLVRIYNPTEEAISAKLKLGFDFDKAYSIKLDGRRNEELNVVDNAAEFSVGRGKIYTVEIV